MKFVQDLPERFEEFGEKRREAFLEVKEYKDKGVPVICCGELMPELKAGVTDAAVEKHVPVVKVEDNKVTVSVGSVEHPMTEAHYITLIVLETKNGTQFKQLTPSDKPEAVFYIGEGDEVVAAYDYCNLHGLWKA